MIAVAKLLPTHRSTLRMHFPNCQLLYHGHSSCGWALGGNTVITLLMLSVGATVAAAAATATATGSASDALLCM